MSQVDLGSLYPPCPPPSINLVFPKPFGCCPSFYLKSNIRKVAYRHMIWPLSSSHSSSLALCYVIMSFLKSACSRKVLCSSSVGPHGSSNELYHFASRPSNVLLVLLPILFYSPSSGCLLLIFSSFKLNVAFTMKFSLTL